MAKKKGQPKKMPAVASPPKDRHKPSRMVRIPASLANLVEKLAERNYSSLTQETKRALKELLEREQLIPPPRRDH